MKSGPIESGEATEVAVPEERAKSKVRGVSILDLILRFIGVFGTLGSAVAMGTTDQTLPFFTQFILRARYKDLPAFTFFVIANSIVCGYLFISLPVSVFHLIRNAKVSRSRAILVAFDTVMLALLTSGASAAAAIVYLAHEGNGSANWPAFCRQFDNFCQRISGSLIGSFAAVVVFIVMIIASTASMISPSQYKV